MRAIVVGFVVTVGSLAIAQDCQPLVTSVGGTLPGGPLARVDGMVSHPRGGAPALFVLRHGLPSEPWNQPEERSNIFVWQQGWQWGPVSSRRFPYQTTLASYDPPPGSSFEGGVYAAGYSTSAPSQGFDTVYTWLSDSANSWSYLGWWNESWLDRARMHNTPLAVTPVPYPSASVVLVGGDFRDDSGYSDLVMGCWQVCDTVTDSLAQNEWSVVRAMAFYAVPPSTQYELYAGGLDLHERNNPLVRWDGFSWQSVHLPSTYDYSEVRGLKVHAGSLWITTNYRVARYNEQGLQELPDLPGVECLEWFDDGSGEHLYAGGSFQITPNALACQVAKFDGVAWQQVGIPFSDSEVEAPTVKSLVVHDMGQGPRLVAGGYFHRAGNRLLDNMAVWDGLSWRAIGDSTCYRSATYHDDGTGRDLYGVAWSIRNSYWPRPDRVVRRHEGELQILGSDFPMGSVLEHIYSFDLGQGPQLYAVGDFSAAPGGVAAHGIAHWDGTVWKSVGPVSSDTVYIREALVWDEDGPGPLPPAIYVTGAFTAIGGVAARNVARWDGSTWSALDQGLADPGAYMLVNRAAAPNELVIATTHASDVGELARWNGHWTFSPAPTREPFESGCMMAVFDAGNGPHIYLVSYNPLAPLQRFDGAAWSPVTTPLGYISTIATFDDGNGPALLLQGSDAAAPYRDAIYRWRGGSFEPVVGLPYANDVTVAFDGSIHGLLLTSGVAAVGATFIRPCRGCGSADFNCDGDVGTDVDIAAFFACLSGTCPLSPCTSTADFNADGDVGTDADIEAFFRVLAGGIC